MSCRIILRLAVIAGSLLAGLGFLGASEPSIQSIRRLSFVPNPDGLQVGFWANYIHSGEILRDFGPRPFERVSFYKWAQIEKAPGQLQWGKFFESEKRAHLAGSSVITNVNTFFARALNPQGMDAIPTFYEQDIRNPETRRMAKKFLAEFVTRALEEAGSISLLLDYEFLWFAKPRTPEIRRAYRDWFLEAAQVCRETARSLGKADQLRIGCCVNTNPFDTGESLLGSPARPFHEPQQWLLDVVAACDFFAIDCYAQTQGDADSPAALLEVAKFWIEHYAGNKEVFITENGFSSAVERGLADKGYHARGTEAEQAEFFRRVFSAFERRDDGDIAFLRRIRGYGIWMYRDMPGVNGLLEQSFGITREDGSQKPAWGAVKTGIETEEENPRLSPVGLASSEPIALARIANGGVELSYQSGVRFQTLEVTLDVPPGLSDIEISVTSLSPACLVVHAPQGGWVSSFPALLTRISLRLPVGKEGGSQKLRIYLTSEKYPFTTKLKSLGFRN